MKGSLIKACTVFIALSMVFFACTGAGCLVDNKDENTAPKGEVLPSTYWLDIDQNGTKDFLFTLQYATQGAENGTPQLSGRIGSVREGDLAVGIVQGEDGEEQPFGQLMALEEGVQLDADSSNAFGWSRFSETLYSGEPNERWQGPFAGVERKYIGLRLGPRDSLRRYGWVLLSVDTTAHQGDYGWPAVRLHDYAVRSEPGVPIETGEKP